MTLGLRQHGIRSVLLDIEGTTTPIAFVYDVLFPFARRHVREFLNDHIDSIDVRAVTLQLRSEWTDDAALGHVPPDWPDRATGHDAEPIATYVWWLMDQDRKSAGLKALQGHIWDIGYRSGVLRGEVFDDVPAAFERWSQDGIGVAIYSSGSVLAQRLLFGTTASGDLTRFISAYFDTAVGSKTSPDSYRRIADALEQPPAQILFVSDVGSELDAAQKAGCQVTLCVRPGNPTQSVRGDVPVVRTLDDIVR